MSNEIRDRVRSTSYFLVSLSTHENLELCLKYALAGFPSGESGAWTFCEINEGDFISFLYGAKICNLCGGAVTFAVRVSPRASRDAIEGEYNGALCQLLGARLNVPISAVRIVAGEKNRNKSVTVAGVSKAQVEALAASHGGTSSRQKR